MSDLRKEIIQSGVSNLKEYGYPSCNSENILTDKIYSAFFKNMLHYNFGQSPEVDVVINELLAEIGE